MNWIRKYWWVVMLFLIAFPFGLNYIITRIIPFDWEIAGEPKDWLAFWGAYISSILSFVAIYVALESLNFQIRSQIANIIFKIVAKEDGYYLEITNNGNTVAYDILITSNDKFNNTLGELQKAHFCSFQNKKFILKPDEKKFVPITIKELKANQIIKILDFKTGREIPLILEERQLERIRQEELILTGSYMSLGRKITINDKHTINKTNFCFVVLSKDENNK